MHGFVFDWQRDLREEINAQIKPFSLVDSDLFSDGEGKEALLSGHTTAVKTWRPTEEFRFQEVENILPAMRCRFSTGLVGVAGSVLQSG